MLISTYSLKHSGIWGWGIYGLNGWGTMAQMGGAVVAIVIVYGIYAKKNNDLQGSTLPVIT